MRSVVFERIYPGAYRTDGALARAQNLRSIVRQLLQTPLRVGHLALSEYRLRRDIALDRPRRSYLVVF